MTLALLGFAGFLAAAFLGVPLGFAMLLVGTVGFALVRGWTPALEVAGQTIVDTAFSEAFIVVPLFVLMGNFVYRADISTELYRTCYAFLGHLRGGLAMATVAACGFFGSVCGSSVATAATMGKVALPEMRRYRYRDELALGSIAAGGTVGILIPPSVPLVIYGILTETNIAALFAAGVIPGIMQCIIYILLIGIWLRLRPDYGPPGERTSWLDRLRSLRGVIATLGLFAFITFGIYGGIFTPSEAGGIGAIGALAIAVARRKLSFAGFFDALQDAGSTTAKIFFVAFGALMMSNFVEIAGLPRAMSDWIAGLDVSPMGVIVAIVFLYILLGIVFEGIGMILLTVPIFAPIVAALGFDMVWFGILVIIVTEISIISPPLGMNMFILKAVGPDISLPTIYRGVLPFLAGDAVRVAILVLFPITALWLPNLLK